MKTFFILLVVIVVVIVGAYIAFPAKDQAGQIEYTNDPSGKVYVGNASYSIFFTNEGYSPDTLTIKKGDQVIFVNQSDMDFWPASAIHPTHEVYPEGGGCLGSAFDACDALTPGTSWAFTFNEVGEWKFHDHLSPNFTGTIIVHE